MKKFRKDLFYSPDQWVSQQPNGFINTAEGHFLLTQARLTREALEAHLENLMEEEYNNVVR